jgi:hypothetical protein
MVILVIASVITFRWRCVIGSRRAVAMMLPVVPAIGIACEIVQ